MIRTLLPDENVIKILNKIIAEDVTIESDYGITKQEFFDQTLPNYDVHKDPKEHHYPLAISSTNIRLSVCAKILGADECTNAILYQPHSMMEWHTNSDNPGTRIYYVYTEGESIFRYIDLNGNEVLSYDNVGWTVREFTIPTDALLWHTIWTEKKRYAFGFNKKANVL
jgi:hypothetical protein